MGIEKLPILVLQAMPKFLIKPVAFKYVAGEKMQDAIDKVKTLNSQGIKATLDILGEAAEEETSINYYVEEYRALIDTIAKEKLKSGISIKPTAFGLSKSYDLAFNHIKILVEAAKKHNIFIRIDMEDSPYTDATIRLYNEFRKLYSRVGIVFQAYLKRTEEDIMAFASDKADIRICKGIYKESPEIAYKGYNTINENYMRCLKFMLQNSYQSSIATHDNPLIKGAKALVRELAVPKEKYEFQMLYGVKTRLAEQLAKDGYNMRIYVPYGKDWHPYSMRRMYENPLLAFHVTKAVFYDSFTYLIRLFFSKRNLKK